MPHAPFPEGRNLITVATQFDERLASLLAAAGALARRTGASVRLVHICDPWSKTQLAAALDGGPTELLNAVKDEAARVARRRLAGARRLLPDDLAVETVVCDGDVVEALAADVKGSGTGLLLIGASRGGVAATSIGFSTAVSVIGEAGVPVLVLNEAATLRGGVDGLRVVVADDLSEVAAAALALGIALVRAIPGSTLVHAHVESQAELAGGRRRAGILSGRALEPPQLAATRRRAEALLRARAGDGPRWIEAAGSAYELDVTTGAVADELDRTACAVAADLVLFGQHRVFHRQTMNAGQMPFKAMLSLARPVIVVPG